MGPKAGYEKRVRRGNNGLKSARDENGNNEWELSNQGNVPFVNAMQMIEGKRDWTHALPRDAVVRLIRADAESGVKEGLPGIEIENMLQGELHECSGVDGSSTDTRGSTHARFTMAWERNWGFVPDKRNPKKPRGGYADWEPIRAYVKRWYHQDFTSERVNQMTSGRSSSGR
ncbi:hypothetical protein THAOC_20686 [Thalassiosira oceanica]|uniref:Uncharacterized protein n=1 Tax=Thalassiosira oceanica TaxID=159749 RepID=K0SL10_THAOC|nr:hypothetical protein THAOC_20686 [Thalassiosira oceanica]|eukprot:EJK59132.1 hypothetical protein THAOC_20686 [Thalassiosira oceanica]